MEKPKCEHYKVCRLYAESDTEPPLCILHSKNPDKDKELFKTSLKKHRRERVHDFEGIFFPEIVDFSYATFADKPNFIDTTFSKGADFSVAEFPDGAYFLGATFSERAYFIGATFSKETNFSHAKFSDVAIFINATFSEETANFYAVTFSDAAFFSPATFSVGANFSGSRFLGKAQFTGRYTEDNKCIPIFSEVKNEVDFRGVTLDQPQALIFRDADLSKCLFEQTDLRKAEFTGVSWPKQGRRFRVYDEIRPLKTNETRRWDHIERLYRELKQNYEDRRDYERAGDFHYGEKEMRRKNPDTPLLHRFLLTFYYWISGYGERYIRPLVWAFCLLVLCTCGYLILGIAPAIGCAPLALTTWEDWVHVALYGLQVMTLLRPTDLVPLGNLATAVKVAQSLLGPIIFGLFALAVRQRLKR